MNFWKRKSLKTFQTHFLPSWFLKQCAIKFSEVTCIQENPPSPSFSIGVRRLTPAPHFVWSRSDNKVVSLGLPLFVGYGQWVHLENCDAWMLSKMLPQCRSRLGEIILSLNRSFFMSGSWSASCCPRIPSKYPSDAVGAASG